jgi:hypothetical protein
VIGSRTREEFRPGSPAAGQRGSTKDHLRGVFREPDGTTASGWNDAEVDGGDFLQLAPVSRQSGAHSQHFSPVAADRIPRIGSWA